MVVQERHARLDARRHRDLVNAHQQQLRQTQLQLEIRHARQKLRIRPLLVDTFQIRLDHTQRRKTIQTLTQTRREHTRLERLVVNHSGAPEQRLVSTETAKQLDLNAFSSSR